ncbi:MAG: 23S rRNA (uracil(1939)-C(5))-methyltransferase RlmD, partial [Oscillospiraceae bacterium]|nr:23S rRNA (uracil(1939)-C(5))-methyltransferase RlmD [Oscillospiraceae bacterium]
AQVAGVELNRDAVRDAIANARRNGVNNCWFSCGDAGAFMERSAEDGDPVDLVFLDPPRAGSDARFLGSLLRSAPERVVYVSCDPDTLARDCAVLVRGGYRVERVQPVDMFPFTEHIESVVSLTRAGLGI